MLRQSLVALALTTVMAAAAQADDGIPARGEDPTELDEIVVVGMGQSRSVQTLLPENLEVLPPGTSIQKALNMLPGVSAQSIDALGVNEQSLTLQVRGFNTTHLGYTLDGMPLGDGAYNNYNGLTISRALISENLGRADLATGIAALGIASTSNLGGALTYQSSDPTREMGARASQSFGSDSTQRTYARFDTGEHGGFSAYLSGHYSAQDLFVDQAAWNKSTGKQLNGKAVYRFDNGQVTFFADLSRTNQADDAYLSKEMLSRLGWDWGGIAPDWDTYARLADCTAAANVPSITCANATAPVKNADVTYTNGQILRNDDLFYFAGDFDIDDALSTHYQLYKHTDKGAGNNWIVGKSTQGTAATADDYPVQIRDTRYTIDRKGGLFSLALDIGFNHLQAGLWIEYNTSSAARYIWTDVTEDKLKQMSLAHFLGGTPSTAQWVQETEWDTTQTYLQDTIKLLGDALSFDFGFKSTDARSDARAINGISATPPPASSQFASGQLKAKDSFLPQVGARWRFLPGNEVFASYAENLAMFQGGFKLGPQSVSQSVWDAQGQFLKPETSKNFDLGYRYVGDQLQASIAAYKVDFNNRLLQYNPCPTNLQQNPGCGNSFHNAGGVTSKGVELGLLWTPLSWLSWYNSASYNKSTYDEDMAWSTGATTSITLPTAGKQQVDTPKQMFASVLTVKQGGFSASLQGKFTGRRYYTWTNDQSFGGYTTFDLGLGYAFGGFGVLKNAKLALNVTNLTDKRFASNFDSSVFAPSDSGVIANGDSNAIAGDVLVFHSSAPRQVIGTFSVSF